MQSSDSNKMHNIVFLLTYEGLNHVYLIFDIDQSYLNKDDINFVIIINQASNMC